MASCSDYTHQQNNSLVDPTGLKAVSRRKLCEFCQKTFHRNSLKRHQKICAGNLWNTEQNKVLCFKENDSQEAQENSKAEDGRQHNSSYPPKLQIADVTDVNSSSEINPRQDPPKLQSVNDDNGNAGLRRFRSNVDESSVPVTKKLRSYSSFKSNSSEVCNSPRKSQSSQVVFKGIKKIVEYGEPISTSNILSVNRAALETNGNRVTDNANSKLRSNGTQRLNLRTSSRLGELFTKPKITQNTSSQSVLPLQASQKRLSLTKNQKTTKKAKSDPISLIESVPTKCLTCDIEFDVQSELISHGLNHIKEGILVCLQCSNKKVDNIDLHFKSDHQSEKKKENCELCNKSVDKNNSLYHYKEHHTLAKNLKCNVCNQKFGFMQNLLYHKSSDHLREAINSKFCQRNGDMMKIKSGPDESGDAVKHDQKGSVDVGEGSASLCSNVKGISTYGFQSKYARYGAASRINLINAKSNLGNSGETKFPNEFVFEDDVDSQGCKMDGASIFSHSRIENSESDKHFKVGITDICGIFISTTNANLSDSESLSSNGRSYYDSVAGLFTEEKVSTKRLIRRSVESGESSRSSYSSISSTSSKTEIDCSIDSSPIKNIFTEGIAAAKTTKTVRDCSVILTKCDSGASTNSSDKDNDEASNDSAINSMKSEWSKSDTLISSNKEYTCRLCEGIRFDSTVDYLTHLKIKHHWTETNLLNPEYEPEYWCPECGLEFIVRPTLVKHLIIAHEEIADVEEYMECLGYGVRPLMKYQCSVCYSVFHSDQELCSHRRCHGLAYLQFLTSSNIAK